MTSEMSFPWGSAVILAAFVLLAFSRLAGGVWSPMVELASRPDEVAAFAISAGLGAIVIFIFLAIVIAFFLLAVIFAIAVLISLFNVLEWYWGVRDGE